MNKKQADKVFELCNKFCIDNNNNRINGWSSGFFIKLIEDELNKILQEDNLEELPPEPPKKRIVNEYKVKPIAPEIIKRKEGDQPKK